MRNGGWQCRLATEGHIPAVTPKGQGPAFLYYVISDNKNRWPWCRLCSKHDSDGPHLNSRAHAGRLESASAAIAALQEGRSTDPVPPAEELHAFDGRNVPAELLALCDGRHLA
eukprot:11211749-Lingulodinium_polyedra.AAC.1